MAKKKASRRFGASRATKLRAVQQRASNTAHLKVPECTANYVSAIIDPVGFYGSGADVCVPDTTVIPSTKRSYRMRGTFNSGTSGFGFIEVTPYRPANNNVAIRHTSSTSVGSFSTNKNTFTNINSRNFNVDWSNTDLTQYRVVACGIRVIYEGSELNKGGLYGAFASPNNSDTSAMSMDDMAELPEWRQARIGNAPMDVIWLPVNATDFTYSGSDASASPYPITVVVSAATGDAQPYIYEVVWYYELSGGITQGRTLSHADPIGFPKAQQVVQQQHEYVDKHGPARHKSVWKKFADAIQDTTQVVGDVIGAVKAGAKIAEGIAGAGMKILPYFGPLL